MDKAARGGAGGVRRSGRCVAVVASLLVAGCGTGSEGDQASLVPQSARTPTATTRAAAVVEPLPSFPAYEPGAEEEFPNAKRIAGRAAQRALTYERGAQAAQVAARLQLPAAGTRQSLAALAPAVVPGMSSAAEVIYVQMAGTTDTTFGAMVVVRQVLQDGTGDRRAVTRTADVRLRRSDGPWSVQTIASVGGSPVQRPRDLPAVARRVLDEDRITLTDTARWDIHRGGVDAALLEALLAAAQRHRFSVAVLNSGHPQNVWQTNRRSAHSSGFAADIYAVDGRLVIRQRSAESAAYRLARRFAAAGARQLGSPWDFDNAGRASFTDAVHQDHIHLQQTAVGMAG